MDVLREDYNGGENWAIWMVFVSGHNVRAGGYVVCTDMYYSIFRASFRTLK